MIRSNYPITIHEYIGSSRKVQKTKNVLCTLTIDQCHEQVNEMIKGNVGAVGLTENLQSLERWTVTGQEISRVILEFEKSFHAANDRQKSHKHHEQYPGVQKYTLWCLNLTVFGNQYLEDSCDLFSLDTKIIMAKDMIHTVYNVQKIGN